MFLLTDQLKRVIRKIEKTAKDNGWLLVTGEVGTGKTTLRRHILGDWAQENNYLVLSVTSWKGQGRSRVPALMRRMILSLSPDTPVPGDVELREEKLRSLLLRMQYKQKQKKEDPKKVILLVDSAQDVSDSTFRELKKLREIHTEPLFSIIMFGNESLVMDSVMNGREVGYRCKHVELKHLDDEEVLDFAEKRFEISFESGKSGVAARTLFCETVHPSPLGVEYFRSCLDDISGFSGMVTTDLIKQASMIDLRSRMKKAKVLISDITKEAKANGIRLNTTEAATILSGKSKASTEKIQQLQNLTERVIRNKQ
nr:ATP-binding protein [Leptospira interrogans]